MESDGGVEMTNITTQTKKYRPHIQQAKYREACQKLDWFTREQLTVWFHGETGRDRGAEKFVSRESEKGKLQWRWYGKMKVYCVPRIHRKPDEDAPAYINHGLGCSEVRVRFYVSDRTCELPKRRNYVYLGIVPDAAFTYPNGKTLLVEYSTADNIRTLKSKLEKYEKVDENTTVLFVLDVPANRIQRYVNGNYFFVDYDTFTSVPYGEQLTSSIYIWGGTGETLPLRYA